MRFPLSLLLFLRCILVVFIRAVFQYSTSYLFSFGFPLSRSLFRLDYVEIDLPHQLTPLVYRRCITVLFFVSIFPGAFSTGSIITIPDDVCKMYRRPISRSRGTVHHTASWSQSFLFFFKGEKLDQI
jgi:hypothetical protein